MTRQLWRRYYLMDVNCYPKINRKKFTAWCEECNLVFEDPTTANKASRKGKT